MKRLLSLISLFLLICIIITGCNGSQVEDTGTEAPSAEVSTGADTEPVSSSEVPSSTEPPSVTEVPDEPVSVAASAVLGPPFYSGEVCGDGTVVSSNIKREVTKYNSGNSSSVSAPSKFSDAIARVYNPADKEEYDAYIAKLLEYGCQKLTENKIGEVCFTTLKAAPERLITAYFIPSQRLVRVIDEPYHDIDTVLPSPENAPSGLQTSVITMPVVSDHEQSCFVITLSDGRLVLYDTGYTNVVSAEEGLINTLKEYSYYYNNTPEKKIRIAAIFVSHLHDDHYGGLLELAKRYSNIVTVERVYANFPSTQKENYWDNPMYVEEQAKDIIAAAKKLGAEFKFVRSGQKVRMADADFEIMYTPDDLGQHEIKKNSDGSKSTSHDINNTCLYVRMTVKGKTAIFCGDSRQGQTPLVCRMYKGDLKCDILTVAHHGYNASDSKQLYTVYGRPTVLLWTNTKKILAANTSHRSFIDTLQGLSTVTEHVYPEATKRAVYVIE